MLWCRTATVTGSLTQSQGFFFHWLPGPRRAHRVHPGAPCLTPQIPSQNRLHFVPPKTEQSTPAHALELGGPLSPRVSCPEWPDRREQRHGQVWERLL